MSSVSSDFPLEFGANKCPAVTDATDGGPNNNTKTYIFTQKSLVLEDTGEFCIKSHAIIPGEFHNITDLTFA